jgi:ribonuclease R
MQIINRKTLLDFFDSTRRPLTYREIISRFQPDRKGERYIKRLLRDLLRDGELIITRKGRYGLPEEMRLVRGYFEAHKNGYGFVIPEEHGKQDIFIPPRATIGAMEGDRVIARVENIKKREGAILRILERARSRVVGRLEVVRGVSYIVPKRKDLTHDFHVAPGNRGKARDGDLVVAEILTYPTDKRPPTARVVRKLKQPETALDDIELLIDELNIPRRFTKKAIMEAKRLPGEISEETAGKRKDLRKLLTVTIDGERARDFDDAVSIKLRKFGYTLYVHIADVSHFVPWACDIDSEAKKRGTSVYFPDRAIPMLPRKLSEDLCSLKPKVPRLAFTVEMHFSRDGERLGHKLYPSLIQSDERMTYTEVKKILIDEDRKLRAKYNLLLRSFELMGELCTTLRENRLKRGSLDFDLPEPEILLDLRGNPENIVVAERNFAHMIIEEFMIAANEVVAEHIYSKGLPFLYRIHEPPDLAKMEEIQKVLRTVSNIRKKRISPDDLPHIISTVRGRPEEDVVNYLILRSLKQARYSTENAGHFGLASSCYTHFTSPIRRYPDLVAHRIIKEAMTKRRLKKERVKELEEMLSHIALHSSRMERLADDAERTAVDTMRTWFMDERVGDAFSARIVGITNQGLRIRLKEFYVDGFLHVSYLTDDYYIFDESNLQLRGRRTGKRYSIGDEVNVRIDRVDLEERDIVFGVL